MFIGEYAHAIDQKGRLAVPTKFREDLETGAVVTRGLDGCLVLYTASEWEKLAAKLSQLPISKANTRAFSRFMLSGAMDLQLDGQGRITLPEYLRTYAGISKKVVITGLYNRLEIWNEERWSTYKRGTEKGSVDIAEALEGLDV